MPSRQLPVEMLEQDAEPEPEQRHPQTESAMATMVFLKRSKSRIEHGS
jgi:hypothetical protein